jgi:hypothetical protein
MAVSDCSMREICNPLALCFYSFLSVTVLCILYVTLPVETRWRRRKCIQGLGGGRDVLVKGEVPHNRLESPEGGGGITLHCLVLGARRGWVVSTTPRPLYPGKDPVRIVQEAGWAPGSVWTCAKNLALPGFDPQTIQPVASRYIDWAIPAHEGDVYLWIILR